MNRLRSALKYLRNPWPLAITIGILLTLVSSAYVASPGAKAYDRNRPQLYSPRLEIQVTWTKDHTINDITRPDICEPVITDRHRGFPMAMLNRFGPDSCTQNRYLHPLGLFFNVVLYTFLARGGIALWDRHGHKLKRTIKLVLIPPK